MIFMIIHKIIIPFATVVEALTYYLIRPECHEEARALLAREMRRS